MFTGIVEGTGKVKQTERRGPGKRLILELPSHLTALQLGDSINVNGACLTVARTEGRLIDVDLSAETLERTAFGDIRMGDSVNVERALKLSDRLGGHLVTGHIDGVGKILQKQEESDFLRLTLQIPGSLMKYVVEKGSIAIDGISLTVNACRADQIQLTLIPYTLEKTTLLEKKVGDRINVEADVLAKYVESLLGRKETGSLDLPFLRKHGFMGRGEREGE